MNGKSAQQKTNMYVVGKKNQETKIDVNVGKHDTHVVGRVLATVRMELALFYATNI